MELITNFLSNLNFDFIQNTDLNLGGFSLDLNNPNQKALYMIIAIICASFLINILLSRSFLGQRYRIFVAPGVVLHEFSHAFFCLITGAKITKISLFDKEGGKVEHGASKLPVIGQILISLSPFFVGLIAIYLLSQKVGIQVEDLSSLSLTKDGVADYFLEPLRRLDFGSWQGVAAVYLVLSIAVTMAPSAQDLKNIALTLFVLGALAVALYKFTDFCFGDVVSMPDPVVMVLSTVAFLLILSLLLSIVIYVLSIVLKRK